MPDDGAGWIATTLDDQSRKALFDAVAARQDQVEQDSKINRRKGLIEGACLALIGLIGVGIAAWTISRIPPPQASGVVILDASTGQTLRTIPSDQAPSYYPERTREADIEDFITACEGFVPQIWSTVQWHSCMIRATPQEQKRIADRIGQQGPDYPMLPTKLGPDGWAMPTQFPQFILEGVRGTGPNAIYSYEVRYRRTEFKRNQSVLVPYTAHISFAYHPELKMNPEDARDNRNAFQAISFSTVPD